MNAPRPIGQDRRLGSIMRPLAATPRLFWKILIVDDDQGVHDVTKLALSGRMILGRELRYLDAFSGEQAKQVLREHPDIALLFLDVVMETEDAGLRVVDFIRDELGNRATRIILRSGQPGQAPQIEIVKKYDINGYIHKTELTGPKLFQVAQAEIQAYQDLSQGVRAG